MTCPHCGSSNTDSEGTDSMGTEFFECLDCGEQFSDADE
jgi:transposase-like protein